MHLYFYKAVTIIARNKEKKNKGEKYYGKEVHSEYDRLHVDRSSSK